MSRVRVIASIALAVLMIAAPLMALYHAPVASALQPNTTIKVYPYKIVKGQDVLFTVVQTGGAFTPGATLYVKVKNQDSWGTGNGYAWIGLPSGKSQIPKGSVFYLPADYSYTDLLGSNNLATGKAYFLISDSADGSSGVTGAEVDVESGTAPCVCVGTGGIVYAPSDILSVSYSDTSLPEYTVQNKPAEVSPGDSITLKYYVPGNTVYFYWDYYGGQLLATGKGGWGKVVVKIPDAPEGFHFIVAISDTGYGAFNVIYVKPTLIASHFSIAGKAGETVSFTGRGFPANSKLDTTQYVELEVSDGVNTGTMRAEIISGGTADALGRLTLTIRLIDDKPPTVKGGLVNMKFYYAYGDIDDTPGGTFTQGQLGPAGDGVDEVYSVLAISTPTAYGDEVLVVQGATPASPFSTYVGSAIPVAVVNFPAHTKVDVYIGYKLAGSLTTDDRGAALGYISVPELPGYDNDGDQITYTIRAMATDPVTHGTLVGVAANGQDYELNIEKEAYAYWAPSGYGDNADYLATGMHTITVELYGLSPFAKVVVKENISGYGTVNILYYPDEFQPVVKQGSLGPGYFVADADGVLIVQYKVAYAYFLEMGDTGSTVDVYVDASTVKNVALFTDEEVAEYHMIFPAYGTILDVITSPANLTNKLETAGPFQVIHPGDYIEVEFYNLVPHTCYTIQLNGQAIPIYDTNNRPISCAAANDYGEITVRFKVPDSRSVIGFDEADVIFVSGVLKGQVAGGHVFIASSPREDIYGSAQVYVYPKVASPGESIYIVGVNFESGETLKGGFSTIGTPQTATANEHGAVAFEVTVPNVPAGTYAVYIERTVTYETFTTTIEIVPAVVGISSSDSVLAVLHKASGETVTLDVVGVEPNRAYMVYWSDDPNNLGEPLTDTGVPGVGTPLTWFSNSNGELVIQFTVPFGVIYKSYYASIVPADNPTSRILPPLEIVIEPAEYFSLEEPPYVIPGQVFSVDFDFQDALSGKLGQLFPGFFNTSLEFADVQDYMNMLASMGRAYAIITMADGSVDVVNAVMQPLDNGYMRVSFVVPNAPGDQASVIGLEIMFTLTYVPYIYNTSSEYDYPLYNAKSVVYKVGGLELIPGGGLALAGVSGQLATVVSAVNNAVNVITTTVNEMKPVILAINDTVVYMNTTLGVMKAQLSDIEDMINGSTLKILQKGDEIMAEIDTQAGDIMANLDSLAKLVNDAYVEITGNQATIITDLGKINTTLTDLSRMIEELGNQVTIELDSVNKSLAHIIVSEGDQVIAELSTLVNQLQPLIISLNNTVAQLQTSLGTMQASIKDLLAGQAEIEKLVVNQSGAVIAVIKTTAGEMNATLTAALEMIAEGMANVSEQAMAQLTAISNKIDTASSALSSKLDTVMASLKDVSSAVSSLSDKVDAVKGALDNVNTKLGTISSAISSLSGKADDISKKLGDLSTSLSSLSGKVATIQSGVADVKSTLSDVKSGVSNLSTKVDKVQSSLNSLSKSVSDLSGKVDKATTESSAAKSRATVLGGTTAGLVIVNIIITALAMARRPE